MEPESRLERVNAARAGLWLAGLAVFVVLAVTLFLARTDGAQPEPATYTEGPPAVAAGSAKLRASSPPAGTRTVEIEPDVVPEAASPEAASPSSVAAPGPLYPDPVELIVRGHVLDGGGSPNSLRVLGRWWVEGHAAEEAHARVDREGAFEVRIEVHPEPDQRSIDVDVSVSEAASGRYAERAAWQRVTFRDGACVVEGVRLVLSLGAAVTGRLLLEDGTPIGNTAFTVREQFQTERPDQTRWVRTDADGTYRLFVEPGARVQFPGDQGHVQDSMTSGFVTTRLPLIEFELVLLDRNGAPLFCDVEVPHELDSRLHAARPHVFYLGSLPADLTLERLGRRAPLHVTTEHLVGSRLRLELFADDVFGAPAGDR